MSIIKDLRQEEERHNKRMDEIHTMSERERKEHRKNIQEICEGTRVIEVSQDMEELRERVHENKEELQKISKFIHDACKGVSDMVAEYPDYSSVTYLLKILENPERVVRRVRVGAENERYKGILEAISFICGNSDIFKDVRSNPEIFYYVECDGCYLTYFVERGRIFNSKKPPASYNNYSPDTEYTVAKMLNSEIPREDYAVRLMKNIREIDEVIEKARKREVEREQVMSKLREDYLSDIEDLVVTVRL